MSNLDERDLARELHARSDDMTGSLVGLGAVKAKARRIQRTRRVVGGAVAAVVLAVAVPAGLSVSHELTNTAPPQPAGPTPTVVKSAIPRPAGPVPLTTTDLPRGEEPQVRYVLIREQKLVGPDGTADLPQSYRQIAPYADGWIAVGAGGRRGDQLVMLDADFQVTRSVPGGQALAVSDDGTQVAYVERGQGTSTLVAAPTDGSDPLTWQLPGGPETAIIPVGFLGDGTVAFYDQLGAKPAAGVASPGGKLTELDGFLRLTDASAANGLVAGLVSYGVDKSCWGVMNPAASTTELVWRTCDYSLGAFSPDGRFVIAGEPGDDGLGDPSLSILDAQTGEPLVEYRQDREGRLFLPQVVWEDATTVLATVLDGDTSTIVRADTAGHLEEAIEPVPTPPMSYSIWFATAGLT